MLINDKKVFVGHHVTKKERESKQEETRQKFTNVFVKNLPETFTDEEFTQMFSKFGLTTSAVLSKNEDGVSKGFGFINFGSSEEAHVIPFILVQLIKMNDRQQYPLSMTPTSRANNCTSEEHKRKPKD